MADDSNEVPVNMPFHPTDSPRGMHYYNMDILTSEQQEKLNQYKLKYIRNTDEYLNENPTVRALVAIIYRVVLQAQPKRNLHLTIAEYFSKPRDEIEYDVLDYLQKRLTGPQMHEFKYTSESVEGDIFKSTYSDDGIASVKYSEEKEAEGYMKTEVDFMHSLLTKNLNATLEARPSATEEQLHFIKYQEIDVNLAQLNRDVQAIIKSQLKGVPITERIDSDESKSTLRSETEGKVKDKARKKTTRKGSTSKYPDIQLEKSEANWLIFMSAVQAEKFKMIKKAMDSAIINPEQAHKWYIGQMAIAEKQWTLLQAALHGSMSQDVQDALRDWQLALMANTQDMSPEIKETQMEWIECQMTQGGTMSKSMVEILRLWQSQIILQGSVMTPEMIQTEILKLEEDLKEIDKLPIDVKEEERERIDIETKQMESVYIMVKEIQELERQWLQNKIDQLSLIGCITPQILSMQMKHLKLYKEHGLLTDEEFNAKENVVNDQMSFGNNLTYETLIAHKRWIEWQLAERKLTPTIYDIQREFLNYQLGTIGVTNSQILLSQMKWLESEMQNSFINKDAYEHQKEVLDLRIADLNKETIPKLREQLNWLEAQLDHGNITENKCDAETAILKEKMTKIIAENKTVEDLQHDLKLLQKEFGEGKIPETEFVIKKKNIRERIVKLKETASQTLLAEIQILDAKFETGDMTQEEYDENKLAIQRDVGSKGSDITDASYRGSIISTTQRVDSSISNALASPIQEQQTEGNIKEENDEDRGIVQERSPSHQDSDTSAAADVSNLEEEVADPTTERHSSIPLIPQQSGNFQLSQINTEKSSEDVNPVALDSTSALPASTARRVSLKFSISDLNGEPNEGNRVFRHSMLEVVSSDKSRSIRRLLSVEEIKLESATEEDPSSSPI